MLGVWIWATISALHNKACDFSRGLFTRRYARICIQGREWSPHVGEIVRLVRNDLSTALCEVIDPTSHHPRPPYSWSVRLLETGQVLVVYTLALDPVSPLEALAAQAVT